MGEMSQCPVGSDYARVGVVLVLERRKVRSAKPSHSFVIVMAEPEENVQPVGGDPIDLCCPQPLIKRGRCKAIENVEWGWRGQYRGVPGPVLLVIGKPEQ